MYISNLIYRNKKLPYSRALQLFNSLVTPIALYACEYWLPFNLSQKSFESTEQLIQSWETLKAEVLHQKICRLILSVMKNTSRAATLGELGEYPLLIKALTLLLKYEWFLYHKSSTDTFIYSAVSKMKEMASRGKDCWYTRVNKIKNLLKIQNNPRYFTPSRVGKNLSKNVKGNFDSFWIRSINKVQKNGCTCPRDHNKFRFYKSFKGSFSAESYIELIKNRNQRSFLTRFRVSSHRLRVETGRWTFPKTPFEERICVYCDRGEVDNELHCITKCKLTEANRHSLYTIIGGFDSSFSLLNNDQQDQEDLV